MKTIALGNRKDSEKYDMAKDLGNGTFIQIHYHERGGTRKGGTQEKGVYVLDKDHGGITVSDNTVIRGRERGRRIKWNEIQALTVL